MKKTVVKSIRLILSLILLLSVFPVTFASAEAADEIVRVTKQVNPTSILEGGEADVTVNVQGSDGVNFVKPNDIILIIDRSGSMLPQNNNGEDKMTNAKNAAKGFVDLIDFSKHRVGVVDFASDVKSKDLSSNPADIKNYITGINASGGTATMSAIKKAQELLRAHRTDAQPVILLLTDGEATEPAPVDNARKVALEQANAAKGEGTVFYTIALLKKTENPDTSAPNLLMKDMATTSQHHHFVLGSVGLAEIYQAIVSEIGVASAYDVTVKDSVAPEFEIVPGSYKDNIPQPTVSGNTLTWKFNELKKEKLTFNYKIRHKAGQRTGDLSVGSQDIDVTFKDYLGVPSATKVVNPLIKVSYPAPEITSIMPDKGSVIGGETIVLNGKNFRTNPAVVFGNKDAVSVQFVDSTKLVVVAPPGNQGAVELKVTNNDGQSATVPYYYFAVPEFISVTPSQGVLAGGNDVVITGKYFLANPKVKFGQHEAVIKSSTSTQITATVPAGDVEGFVDIEIVNSDNTSVTAKNAYEYLVGPSVTEVTPNQGSSKGGDLVTIKGSHFKSGAVVKFNTTAVPTEFVSATELKVTTPAWPRAESVKVTVINPDKLEGYLDQAFKYLNPAPTIESVSPNSGLVSGGDLVTITGTDFLPDAKILFKDKEMASSFVDSKHLRVRSPKWTQEETVDITVTNPDGQSAVLNQSFSYKFPQAAELVSLSPISGPLDGGNVITVKGTNLSSDLSLYVADTKVLYTLLSSDTLTFKAPKTAVAGKVDIKVTDTYNRESILKEAYEYLAPAPLPAPTISGVTPSQTVRTGGEFIYVNGDNFQEGAVVWLNDSKQTTSFMSTKQLRFRAPVWGKEEIVTVKVVNPDSQFVVSDGALKFTNPPADPAPEISSLTPDSGEIKGDYFVTINGKYFKSGAKVTFGGKELTTSFLSDTQLRVRAPQGEKEGPVEVKVVNPDGLQAISTFTYTAPVLGPAPVITTLSPAQAPVTGGIFVVINGENFNAQSSVKFGDKVITTSFLSDKQLRVRIPVWTKAEKVDVSVSNADGQVAVSVGGFEYIPVAPAVVTGLTPNHIQMDLGGFVVIDGANFDPATKVYFGDKEASVSFLSDKQLRARAPIWSKAETVSVKVVNPDGQITTVANGFTFDPIPLKPAPTISTLSPNHSLQTGGDLVYVNGSNFIEGAKVSIDGGTPIVTSFFSSNQLRFRIPASSKTGPVDVKVINPDGQFVILANGFTYDAPPMKPAPTISNLTPNNALNSSGELVYINGSNFMDGAKVSVDGATPIATSFLSSTQLRFRIPITSKTGPVDIKVINPDGQTVTLVGGFTYR
ncbi:VWA domain-containing protein [Paenibacillus chitinolyticus]|uniref:IPT/TIG domain-containing protein n=1 Tax=Paenibacillus chitinolyticus TaxID=79263 RepID=A0A410WQP0_9BACL|nr:IPT/TIG domain-containing protein [Paenibacillus chitinolyticus]MCY9591686.1 IPT/TIG domain-containing protein [Paenibacillus chitinolyticus]MCY9596045.1 IPT/TIG domain-containing protein [Paenibacillus chitinolyticus]QAV16663.1 VWA domain-containing protein [Paenibacillus chitinolyticus]